MALVQRPYVWSGSFADNNGNLATAEVRLPAGITPVEAQTYGGVIAAAMDILSNAELRRWAVSTVFEEDAPTTPPAESEVERKLVCVFRASNGQVAKLSVPSPVFGIEVAGTDIVDPANLSVAALALAITNGPLGPGNGAVTNAGADIVSLERAFVTHRGRKV